MKKLLLPILISLSLFSHAQLVGKDKQVAKLSQRGNMIELWQRAGTTEYYIKFLNKEYTALIDVKYLAVGDKDSFRKLIDGLNAVDKDHDFVGLNYTITVLKAPVGADAIEVWPNDGGFFWITKKHIKEFEKVVSVLN